MAKNVALFGRRELVAHRRFVTGVTASVPEYKEVDSEGNKEWVVDVYIGPLELQTNNVIKDVLISPYARHLIGDIRQPVTLERSKQGKYSVIGRSKVLPGGVIDPDGDISDPTFHLVLHNYRDLGISFIADLDYVLEQLQEEEDVTELQADPDEPLQRIRAYDAFGNQVLGPEVDALVLAGGPGSELAGKYAGKYGTVPTKITKAIYTKIGMSKFGPKGDPEAMDWGVSVLSFPIVIKVEVIE